MSYAEDIDDFSDSIFGDEPLDEVDDDQIDEDTKVRNKQSGKVYTVKNVNPQIHDVVKDDTVIKEPKQHSLDNGNVGLSKDNNLQISNQPAEFDYDDDDNLVAVNKREKELLNSMSEIHKRIERIDNIIKAIRNDLMKAKDELERPNVNHDEVKKEIDKYEEDLAYAKSTKQNLIAKKQQKAKEISEYFS